MFSTDVSEGDDMIRRREVITLLGGAAAWPVVARAQQAAVPVIGFLGGFSPAGGAEPLRAFRQGLSDAGYFENRNFEMEYRWAEGRYDRLPAMAADLVSRRVAVILASPTASALAAKEATTNIPVVFLIAGDPVQIGLVASLNRPGGNVTGATFYVAQLVSRQLAMLHELLPGSATIGVLVNPNSPAHVPQVRELQTAANALGLRLHVANAANEREAEAAFATLRSASVDALFVTSDGIFSQQLRDQLVALAARHRLPTLYGHREYVEAGGLICYTSSVFDAGRQAGVYAGRILKGQKPADLPVTQPTKFELVINLRTARALGLNLPNTLLALADAVIE
jgi:putative ABC transport system substrate-binding protein